MEEKSEACLICKRIAAWQSGENDYFIHEFKNSILVVGEHQFYRGYSLLLLKDHVRELHELAPPVQIELFQELMTAGRAIFETFQPWKMNYSCYGNAVPHIHWHLFPRYASEPDRTSVPWLHAAEFKEHATDSQAAQNLAGEIKANLIKS